MCIITDHVASWTPSSLVLGYHRFHGQQTLTSLAHALHVLLCHLDGDSSQVYICRQMCHLFEISFKACFLGNSSASKPYFRSSLSFCHLPESLIVLKKTVRCIGFPMSLPTPLLLLQRIVYENLPQICLSLVLSVYKDFLMHLTT